MTNSRNKGSRNERNVAKLFEQWTGYEFARTPQSGGLHWKKQYTSGDIVCIDERHAHRFPFSIECKFHAELEFHHLIDNTIGKKSNKIVDFWEQSCRDAKTAKKVPIVFMRKNGMPADMHFVMVHNSIFSVIAPEEVSNIKYGYIGYISKKYQIMIFNSLDLFSWDYRLVRKNIRKHVTRR